MTQLLVIEDEAPLRETILTIVRYAGFEAVGARDGVAGVDLARAHRPDLVLSDIRMPEMDGYGVLQTLRADPETAALPFIFLTAKTEHHDIRQGMELGADDYLTKPFTNDELLAAIASRLERQSPYLDLQQRLTMVSQSEQLKTDMIRIAAHDLRNPLTAVRVSLHLLKRKYQVGLLQNGLDEIEQIATAAAQMEAITTDILSIERVEALARGGHLQPVDLAALVEASYSTWHPQAQAKGLVFELEINATPIPVLADPPQLREALHNLMANAVKYTPDGGQVFVRADRMGRMCRVTVEDNGYGIPQSQLDHLFQPFYRVQTPETATIEGSGLGLHLVKNIVQRHQGEVLAQSIYGEGSVFGFFLPVHQQASSPDLPLDPPVSVTHRGLVKRLIGRITSL